MSIHGLYFSSVKRRLQAFLGTSRTRASKIGRLLREPRLWPVLWPGLRHGVFPSLEHASVKFGSEFYTVLDVGASRGQFALFALTRFPNAQLVCFEPLPESYATLRKVMTSKNAKLHNVALGSSRSETMMHVSTKDDSSSLLAIGAQQVTTFPGTHEDRTTKVTVDVLNTYLDNDLPRPCLLKIDVQGFELEVLKGAGDGLARVDEVLVEASFVELYTGQALADEVIRYLADRDLRLVDVHGVVRSTDEKALQADFLFRRSTPSHFQSMDSLGASSHQQ
jgi:FkbM family methyltransferase